MSSHSCDSTGLPAGTVNLSLLYRYWWNTRIFPFTKKSYLHCAQWRYYFHLLCVRILVSPWLLTWSANYRRASRPGVRPVLKWNFIHKMALRREHCTVTGDFLQIFTSILFPSLKNIQEDLLKKKSCVLCRNFISIYKSCWKNLYIMLKVSLTRSLHSLVRGTFSTQR